MKSLNGVAVVAAWSALAVGGAAHAQTTWTVCHDGSCDFTDIQSAIDASASGDLIQLTAETFIAPTLVVHDLNITIAGSRTGTTELSGNLADRIIAISGTSTVQLRNLVFRDGRGSTDNGGAISFTGDHLYITNCQFDNNHAGNGGAIFAEGGHVDITNCNFNNNHATGIDFPVGGAVFADGASTILTNCTLADNHAGYAGGGVRQISGSLTAIGCIFIENASLYGGALEVYANGLTLTLVNCTLIDNTGGGGSAIQAYYAAVRLVNTIVQGNGTLFRTSYGGSFTGAHTIVSHGALSGWGNHVGDPMLSPTLQPLPGSPCIDAGTARLLRPEIEVLGSGSRCNAYAIDVLGNPRFQYASELPPGNTGCIDVVGRIDIGAVERLGSPQAAPRLGDLDADGVVGGTDLALVLMQWGTSECAGDVNADGHVDSIDISELLSHWTTCK